MRRLSNYSLIMSILLLPALSRADIMGDLLTVDVNITNTAVFTVQDWNSDIMLFNVNLQSFMDEEASVVMEFRLSVSNSSVLSKEGTIAWGVSVAYDIPPNGSLLLTNADFTEGTAERFVGSQEFEDVLRESGKLPAGDYEVKIAAWMGVERRDMDENAMRIIDTPNNRLLDLSWDHAHATDDDWSDVYNWDQGGRGATIKNRVVNTITLQDPTREKNVLEEYPWFQWLSPGFQQGINIDYRLRIAQFNPDRGHSSFQDALEDDISIFFDTGWPDDMANPLRVVENGGEQLVKVQFPSGDRDLACGYQYVWQVQAREYVEDFAGDNQGIWGWPAPIESEIRTFNYGSVITQQNVSTPGMGSELTTVRPRFNWDPINCATTYEIWVSDGDDPAVDNGNVWQSDIIQSIPFQYPQDVPGLRPSETYYWKVRINPDGEESPWSEVLNFSIGPIQSPEPQIGQQVNTVRPTFNAAVPTEVSSYELWISDRDDQDVQNANVFSYDEILTLPFQITQAMTDYFTQNRLFPGLTYFWKLMLRDGAGNLVGLPDDYTPFSFTINPITLISPNQGEGNMTVNPTFTWEGPLSVLSYEIRISGAEDTDVLTPFFTASVNGTNFRYPPDADPQLEHGTIYNWRVVPLDANGVPGPEESFTEVRQFTTMERELEPAPGLQVSVPLPRQVQFSISPPVVNAEAYHLIVGSSAGLGGDGLIDIPNRLWEKDDLTLTNYTLTSDEYELDYSTTYYAQGVALRDDEAHSLPSEVISFTTGEEQTDETVASQPQFYIDVTEANPRVPTVHLSSGVEGATNYTIEISNEIEFAAIRNTFENVTSFPQELTALDPELDFDQTYYIRITGFNDNGEQVGAPGDIVSFNTGVEPGANQRPEISLEPAPNNPLAFNITLLAPIEGANTYRLTLASDQEMATVIAEENVRTTAFPYTFSPEGIAWGGSYYVRAQGVKEGEDHGLPSQVRMIQIENKPGADEQVGIEVSVELSSIRITINILNQITGATGYVARIASDEEMSNVLWESSSLPPPQIVYNDPGQPDNLLEFGQVYYVQVDAYDADGPHGIQSNNTPAFVPSIEPATLAGNPTEGSFSWEPTEPQSAGYRFEVSLNQDFSPVHLSQAVTGTSVPYSIDNFNYGTGYYWRVRGFDDTGSPFGPYSDVGYFETEPYPAPTLNSPTGGAEVSLHPEFSWVGIDGAAAYLFELSGGIDFENIHWSRQLQETSVTYPSFALALETSTNYYWRVSALSEGGQVLSVSESGGFTTGEEGGGPTADSGPGQPVTVTGLLPADGANVSSTTPTFSWDPADSVAAYQVQFSNNSGFENPWSLQTGASSLTYPSDATALELGNTYFWQVRALNNQGTEIGPWSDGRSFTLTAEFIVTLNSPSSGASVSTLRPQFSWGAIDAATGYEIEVASDEEYSSILWKNANISESTAQYPSVGAEPLEYDDSYYWRVRALNEDGPLGDFSGSFNFSISASKIPVIQSPNNVTTVSTTPSFLWQSVLGAQRYGIEVSTNENFSQIIYSNNELTENRFAQVPTLGNNQTYYWRVAALDQEGNMLGDWSGTGQFTTPSGESVIILQLVEE
ncbi:MAG: hypothetical protein K9N46_02200 [Candidatus Marinimicrobia bacterium]|nr:hypothetical protein [Candidatus Neomarinimicrobiota bacterium]MCF7828290.1 hypothetical protein [Candidatus Neomarinimicrobiota bacterium]MCF7879535.1 hypothetical protein [Candidatus Neomarinimicrobiota bacterium]